MASASVTLTYRKPKSASASVHANANANDQDYASTQHDQHQDQETEGSKARSRSSSIHLLTWEVLPEWHQEAPFIRSGYRSICHSTRACFQSILAIHNETVNIWTHLVPALGFTLGIFLLQYAIHLYYPEASMIDRLVFAVNSFCAMVTMSLSSLYHTLMCHSERVSQLWLHIDYAGILSLVLGSFFSGIYTGFYCEPTYRLVYWGMIVVLSAVTANLVLNPGLQGLKYRSLRTWAFILTAMSGFAPIMHGLILHGWQQMWIRSGMPYYFLEGAFYGLGAFFYLTSVPESIWPGRFDIWCSSHQIFHVLVVIAALAHLYGVWDAFRWHYQNQGFCLASATAASASA